MSVRHVHTIQSTVWKLPAPNVAILRKNGLIFDESWPTPRPSASPSQPGFGERRIIPLQLRTRRCMQCSSSFGSLEILGVAYQDAVLHAVEHPRKKERDMYYRKRGEAVR
jgi:hypothetical protein